MRTIVIYQQVHRAKPLKPLMTEVDKHDVRAYAYSEVTDACTSINLAVNDAVLKSKIKR
jgi:hypothetical protein